MAKQNVCKRSILDQITTTNKSWDNFPLFIYVYKIVISSQRQTLMASMPSQSHVTDDLLIQGARKLGALGLTWLSQNILVSAQEG